MKIPDDLKYDDKGLIPAVIQDWKTGEVLMVAYMNAASVKKTVETGLTWFWSRSRQKFWQKGETSGNVQQVKEILYDCDQDTLLLKVDQTGPACHTGARSCFFRSFSKEQKG
jgi:phosphoribosyl-AMP cyclohydrolase